MDPRGQADPLDKPAVEKEFVWGPNSSLFQMLGSYVRLINHPTPQDRNKDEYASSCRTFLCSPSCGWSSSSSASSSSSCSPFALTQSAPTLRRAPVSLRREVFILIALFCSQPFSIDSRRCHIDEHQRIYIKGKNEFSESRAADIDLPRKCQPGSML